MANYFSPGRCCCGPNCQPIDFGSIAARFTTEGGEPFSPVWRSGLPYDAAKSGVVHLLSGADDFQFFRLSAPNDFANTIGPYAVRVISGHHDSSEGIAFDYVDMIRSGTAIDIRWGRSVDGVETEAGRSDTTDAGGHHGNEFSISRFVCVEGFGEIGTVDGLAALPPWSIGRVESSATINGQSFGPGWIGIDDGPSITFAADHVALATALNSRIIYGLNIGDDDAGTLRGDGVQSTADATDYDFRGLSVETDEPLTGSVGYRLTFDNPSTPFEPHSAIQRLGVPDELFCQRPRRQLVVDRVGRIELPGFDWTNISGPSATVRFPAFSVGPGRTSPSGQPYQSARVIYVTSPTLEHTETIIGGPYGRIHRYQWWTDTVVEYYDANGDVVDTFTNSRAEETTVRLGEWGYAETDRILTDGYNVDRWQYRVNSRYSTDNFFGGNLQGAESSSGFGVVPINMNPPTLPGPGILLTADYVDPGGGGLFDHSIDDSQFSQTGGFLPGLIPQNVSVLPFYTAGELDPLGQFEDGLVPRE